VKEQNGNGTNGTDRTAKGTFARGNKLSTGRRKGSRVKLSEAFLSDFLKEWRRSGPDCLKKLAESNPEVFVKVAATILPRAMMYDANVSIEHSHRLEVDAAFTDFKFAYANWGKAIGADQWLIELKAERNVEPEMIGGGDDDGDE
jgi:hypothetical protein